jgi:cell fate regulator YaaT (PSP1 superfamily)
MHLVQLNAAAGAWPSNGVLRNLMNIRVDEEVVEVRFKNNRKAMYRKAFDMDLARDERIVVESGDGFDLGTVTLTGQGAEEVFRQGPDYHDKVQLKPVFRKATQHDLDIWLKAKARERKVLQDSRQLAQKKNLPISILDVEFRGDGRQATIFYQTGKGVDEENLDQAFSAAFEVRTEMRCEN